MRRINSAFARSSPANKRDIQAEEILAKRLRSNSSPPCARVRELPRRLPEAATYAKCAARSKLAYPANQRFAAPDMPVGAVTGAVQGQSNHSSIDLVLRHARGDVRMMMLHADETHAFLRQGPFCRKIIRMKIVRDDFRLDFENLSKDMRWPRGRNRSFPMFSRSPMCWLRNARLPRVRQIVFFSSPPTARICGTSLCNRTGAGT